MLIPPLGILTLSFGDPRDKIRDQHALEPRTDYATTTFPQNTMASACHSTALSYLSDQLRPASNAVESCVQLPSGAGGDAGASGAMGQVST